jgi:DNA polymerase-3 subunit gamma/tau
MTDEKYLVFARKWRPQTFEDVVGQEHITRTLQNAIASGRIAHAFLFIGSRGIGKTTTARILAKALNCLSVEAPTCHPCNQCDNCRSIAEGNNLDVIEIDGAANSHVDDVREIREHVGLVPSRSRYKVYIIDEVHQLSPGAFSALLKTIEEPPPHVIFILATTEAHKVPPTIVSRCQRFDFRRVGVDRIGQLLRTILDREGVKCTEEALHAVARAAEGGIRDAESILDQLVSYCSGEITFRDVFDVLGLVDWRVMHELCDAIYEKDVARQLQLVEDVVVAGKDLAQFVQDILRYFRNLLVCQTGDAKALLSLPDEEIAQMQAHAARFTLMGLIRLVEQFAELTRGFDSQLAQRIALETLLIRMSRRAVEMSVDTIIEKIMQLSEGRGAVVGRPRPPGETEPSVAPPPARLRVGEENLAGAWSQVVEAATRGKFALKVHLGQVKPVAVESNGGILCLSARTAQVRDALEKAENRRALEDALAGLTENLKTFRCEVAGDAPPLGPAADARHGLPIAGTVQPDEARAALENPHVAKVVDVFKGRIVEIKHETRPAH